MSGPTDGLWFHHLTIISSLANRVDKDVVSLKVTLDGSVVPPEAVYGECLCLRTHIKVCTFVLVLA